MNGNYLLDTNIMIAILNQEAGIKQRLQGLTVFLSTVVLGELYYGAHKSAKVEENLAKIEAVIQGYRLLTCRKQTADYYGQIKEQLRAKGRPLPENDIWIAASAMQYRLTLVSRDAHFEVIDNLKLGKW